MRVLEINHPKHITELMREIKVDPYGIKIMAPKAISYTVRINSLTNIEANILKQEMLSLGGDAALSRDALTGKIKRTDCLLIGNLSQFNRLGTKLNKQPFGLNNLGLDLMRALNNYQRDGFILNLGRYKLSLAKRPYIMGAVNLTPDSFSGDGLYKAQSSKLKAQNYIIDYVEQLVKDGADIIDIGGESSRPGAKPLSAKEELARTIPIIKALSKKIKAPISIDTYKPEVAKQALDNGAVMVNDITGLKNAKMARLVARYKAAVVIMHMQGNPRTMQKNPVYGSLLDEIIEYLQKAINRALCAGIAQEKIIIDPGIGFGKTAEHNLKILRRLSELKVLGRPILVGPSRKSFLGKILNAGPRERIFGTVSSCILAVKNGAKIVRVHDVKEVKQALKVFTAIDNV
jgi:dihydropteroate synthase